MKNRLLTKALALLAMLGILTLGLSLIHDVVLDRINHRDSAVQGVVASLAGKQVLMGPVLVQSCTETHSVQNGSKTEMTTRQFQRMMLPDQLRHEATARMEDRARGLHHVNTYVMQDRISASFAHAAQYLENPPEDQTAFRSTRCGPLRMALSMTDPRGIRHARIRAGEKELEAEPGTSLERYSQGLQTGIPVRLLQKDAALELTVDLEVVGTERLSFVPLGSNSHVSLGADWPHPSFGGSFLPSRREISADGFTAQWNLSALASSARQAFEKQQPLCRAGGSTEDTHQWGGAAQAASGDGCLESVDTDFVTPVNPYSLSDRAIKYGLLFVVLTFVAVGLFEVLKHLRVHPVQYLFVGSALCSFFLLLVSLSEHMGFAGAYGVAATACVLLLAYYASHILGSLRRGLPFAAGIAALYGLLYVLLQLEQTALAVGSVALFAALALIMVSTRRVDWYAFGSRDGSTSAQVQA
ncbi:cell envelope integrity protein CreD [Delftia sp. PS-11]|uniref:cell envelope integrity protein CreD n=1 Tax=Delftia sp. PS-11 TaxID=2767222 RepID=UPI0024564247|nr:cell envelope integrity protein CreD [Delftia sp. PS-11]KAJ8746663.1 cell envelope integrity protein CreD [Delftia sp. PS-11]